MRAALIFASLLLVSGCASNSGTSAENITQQAAGGHAARGDTLEDAILALAGDLNLVMKDLPEILKDRSSPYGPISGAGCAGIRAEVTKLNEALGPDFDELTNPEMTDEERFD